MSASNDNLYKMFGPTSCSPDEMYQPVAKNYFIVGYNIKDDRHRSFGFFQTLVGARKTILSQWKDMEECYYDAFFIEEFSEGIFKIGNIEEYYEINMETRSLVKKDVPLVLRTRVNWSIG
jgi:hypothetical protein